MSMKVSDPIRGQSRGSMGQANAYALRYGAAHQADVEALIREFYRLGALYGVDASVLVAQSAHETAGWTSAYWRTQKNPAGLGAFDDGSYVGGIYPDGTIAAQAQFAHMCAYLGIDIPLELAEEDPRWDAVFAASFDGSVKIINDLGRGKWATDPNYAVKLAAKGNEVFPGISDHIPPQETPPMAITYGLVPHPAYQDRPITKPEGRGQNNLGKRSVKGVVWHRILGSLWGTDGYFRRADVNALTDFGVGVLATDGAQNDGVILKWNDPYGFQSGWASGTYNGAYGDGLAFAQKYGINAINRDQVSIEISGQYTTPLSEKSRDAIAALTAYYADQYRIPWDQFPTAPQDGFSFVRWHQEFTLGTGKVCPGEVVIRETPALIERTRAILKRYQTAGQPVPVPEPEPEPEPTPEPPKEHTLPQGMSRELAARLFGSYRAPWDGTVFAFDLRTAPSQVWLARAKRSIPDGKTWAHGDWPELTRIIRRGNGNQVWVWSDGFTYERRLAQQDSA